jgi:hypothetical protein
MRRHVIQPLGERRYDQSLEIGPNFFVIGAQKAGTTRFCHLLGRHPKVRIPTKEPAFFSSEVETRSRVEWYKGLFDGLPPDIACGDGSTYYSMAALYPGTAERIAMFNDRARIIYMVRHPLRRIESAWAQLLSVGHANSYVGFERTLMETPLLLDPSLYWRQVAEYRRFFPDSQIKILFFEDFVRDEERIVRDSLSFLGINADVYPPILDREGLNSSEGKTHYFKSVDAIRSLRLYGRLKHLVPVPLKALMSSHLRTTAAPFVTWSPQSRAWVLDRVAPDAADFLQYADREPDVWAL